MAITATLLGVPFSIPETSDTGFDGALTAYLKALSTAFPQLNGGVQSLTAELDFGVSFGIKAAWFKSETVNPASAGQIRLAKTDSIKIRNNANAADLALGIDTLDALTFGGQNVTGNPMLGANTTAGQSIPNTGTATIVVFGTVELDTDSAYNSGTGRYTVPTGKGGPYQISSVIDWSAAATGAFIQIFKNAAVIKTLAYTGAAGIAAAGSAQGGSTPLNLAAGDIIDIRVGHTSGGAVTLNVQADKNFFALKRIPA